MNNAFEKLVDANIAVLSKTILESVERGKRSKPLKAEFIRDDLAGGKFYGYRGRGYETDKGGYQKKDVRIRRSRGRFGAIGGEMSGEIGQDVKVVHVKAKPGAKKPLPKNVVPESSSHKAVDVGNEKTGMWRRDAAEILSNVKGTTKSGDVDIAIEGDITKAMTNIKNLLARLAEAEAQYIKVKMGEDYKRAYNEGIQKAKDSFENSLMGNINKKTAKQVVYDPAQNAFIYEDGSKMSPRDISVVNKAVAAFETEAEKAIKAKTTAVRRAEGSDE